jgi:hypothetical protein
MHKYIERFITPQILKKTSAMPAVAILGPRQCGKSTLAKKILSRLDNTLYIDLELPSDLNKLADAEAFFKMNSDKLICIDEIQRAPDLFPLLRSIIDINNRNGQFIILGSASQDLLKQSSESLAGRISYFDLTPFVLKELRIKGEKELRTLWQRGGFPRSYLAKDELSSYEWRTDFIRTFLERDIPSLGFSIEQTRLRRFWMMCAHISGQLLNSSKLGESLGVSHHTVRSYIELLEKTFLLRILYPYEANVKKRLVKSPKIFIRDTGIVHALLEIKDHNQLMGHPVYGSSWEGFVIEQTLATCPEWRPCFYRTTHGSEIDLILEKGPQRIAVECKASSAPNLSRRFYQALQDLSINDAWVIIPNQNTHYPLQQGVTVAGLDRFISYLETYGK